MEQSRGRPARRMERQRIQILPTGAPLPCACEALPVPASIPVTLTEAERFAAAVPEMPPRVRAFFEREDPVPWRPLQASK